VRVRNDSTVQRTVFTIASEGDTPSPPVNIEPNGGEVTIHDDVWNLIKDRPVVSAWVREGILSVGGKVEQNPISVKGKPDENVFHETEIGSRLDPQGTEYPWSATKPEISEQLRSSFMTLEDVARAEPDELTVFDGVGKVTASKLISAAQAAIS
jgi:hypothetical protein